MYNRITSPDETWYEATYQSHISNKEVYDRCQELENEILQHTIHKRTQAIPPANINYMNEEEKPKYKCWKCNYRHPINYKNYCPNCGIKLRDEIKIRI